MDLFRAVIQLTTRALSPSWHDMKKEWRWLLKFKKGKEAGVRG